jgi:hypothetical protein
MNLTFKPTLAFVRRAGAALVVAAIGALGAVAAPAGNGLESLGSVDAASATSVPEPASALLAAFTRTQR